MELNSGHTKNSCCLSETWPWPCSSGRGNVRHECLFTCWMLLRPELSLPVCSEFPCGSCSPALLQSSMNAISVGISWPSHCLCITSCKLNMLLMLQSSSSASFGQAHAFFLFIPSLFPALWCSLSEMLHSNVTQQSGFIHYSSGEA